MNQLNQRTNGTVKPSLFFLRLQHQHFLDLREVHRRHDLDRLEEPGVPLVGTDDGPQHEPLREHPPETGGDDRLPDPDLLGALDVFQAREPVPAALEDPLGTASLDEASMLLL